MNLFWLDLVSMYFQFLDSSTFNCQRLPQTSRHPAVHLQLHLLLHLRLLSSLVGWLVEGCEFFELEMMITGDRSCKHWGFGQQKRD
jgi:hypothetical protein